MRKASVVFLGVLLALAGCSTAGRAAPRAEDAAHLPQKLGIFMGGPFSASYFVEFKGGRLHYTARRPDQKIAAESTLDPTPAQWAAFWAAVERLGVWDWRPEYPNPLVMDGTWWGLALEHGGRSISSKGDNNYPQAGGSNEDAQPSPDFEEFLAAVRDLIGGLAFR